MGTHVRRRPVLPILALGIAAVIAGYAGYASARASTIASAASGATVKLIHTSVGRILGSTRGFTLYMFTADRRNSDRCVRKSGCTSVWPPYTVKGRPSAGPGVSRSRLGTIRLPNGRHQVTYAGHPLYRYTGDFSPGSTYYVGVKAFGGTWLAVNAAGHSVR